MMPHELSQRDRTGVLGDESLRAAVLCAAISCALLLAFTRTAVSENPASRFATMDSLVHDHTFAIDRSHYRYTIDRVVIRDHSYSSKPPMLSAIGASVYWVLVHVTPLSLRDDAQRDATVYVLTLLLAGVPHLILLGYAHALMRFFTTNQGARIWTFASIALGQLGLAYSTTLNNHVPAAMAVFAAFYYAFALRRGYVSSSRYYCYAGLWGGLAVTLDLGALFLSASIGLYLLTFDWRSTLKFLVPAALVPIALHIGLTWRISGGPLPIYLRRELYDYPGSYWRAPRGIDTLNEPRRVYLFNILFGHHGLFSMTPVVALSTIAMVSALLRRDAHYRAEALAIVVPLCVLVVFYTLTTKNYGGNCAGFRWFLPVIPLSLSFVAVWLSNRYMRVSWALFLACLLVSQYHTYAALRDPWDTSGWHRWLSGSA